MNIYKLEETDEVAISLKEYCQNNPFNKEDYRSDDWIVVPSGMKGQTAWNKGLSLSPETKAKISAYQKIRLANGQPESQKLAAKKAISKTNKIKMICEKCGKTNNLGNHKRWHGDNCGIKVFHSEETKQKISSSSRGRVMSEKCKLSLLESNKKRKGKKYPNGYKTKDKILDFS
jgi:ribosomal protein S27AE